ncbi:MAG: hypothetical protein HKN12_05935, partial [Gemmatimonadetes bacterium]|nr:hypothetical protein [Gemmatimonadota bacterium]
MWGAAVPRPSAADGAPDPPARFLHVRDAGTPHAWIAYGDEPALGYGISYGLLDDPTDPDAREELRDFAEWAPSRGITLVTAGVAVPGPARRDAYLAALGDACRRLGSVGIFVQLRASFPGPEPDALRSLLDATGSCGTVFYSLPPRREILDVVEAWERESGMDVLVALPDSTELPADLILAPVEAPETHREIQTRTGCPTVADVSLWQARMDPSVAPE